MAGTIVEVALNGAIPRSVNPNVPRNPEEIARDGIDCIGAGASIVHNHNDESVVRGPAAHDPHPYFQAWRSLLKQEPNAITYPTMPGWRPEADIEERYRHIETLAEWGALGTPVIDLGGFNVGRLGPEGVPVATDEMYLNTYKDMDYMFRICRDLNLPISLAVFEPGHLRAGLTYLRAGWVPCGSMVKLFFDATPMGALGRGLPPTEAALEAYSEMLSGFDIPWMAVACGMSALAEDFYRVVLRRGGHVSVGIERTGGVGTRSNVELVTRAAELCAELSRPALSCRGARELLGLPVIDGAGAAADCLDG